MLGHDSFYYSLVKKYTAIFGTLFNDIHIRRTSDDGQTTQLIKVPLTFSAKEKMLARVKQDPNIDRETAISLPHMAYDMTGIAYDRERKLGGINKVKVGDSWMLQPVPYNIGFRLQIYTNTAEDGLKILEQILPFFQPDFTVSAEMIPGAAPSDVPIVLMEVQHQDTHEGELKDKRMVLWELSFVVKGKLYGPQPDKGQVIKFINANMYADVQENFPARAENVYIQPGMTVGGAPTANISQSIDPSLIGETDNWAYIVKLTDG